NVARAEQAKAEAEKMKAERDMGGMMRRMWGRIWGERDDWSAKPRLIGNPAVSQEYLPTVN
ncbi:MAG: hypothetical protein ACPG4K_05070, partial [Haloferula sp.]